MIISFAIIGSILILISNAATPYVNTELESATLSSGATKISDTNASAGQAVLFNNSVTLPVTTKIFTASASIPNKSTQPYTDPTTGIVLQGIDSQGSPGYLVWSTKAENIYDPNRPNGIRREYANRNTWGPCLGVQGVSSLHTFKRGRWDSQIDRINGKSELVQVTFPNSAKNIEFIIDMMSPKETNSNVPETGKWTIYNQSNQILSSGLINQKTGIGAGDGSNYEKFNYKLNNNSSAYKLTIEATGYNDGQYPNDVNYWWGGNPAEWEYQNDNSDICLVNVKFQ